MTRQLIAMLAAASALALFGCGSDSKKESTDSFAVPPAGPTAEATGATGAGVPEGSVETPETTVVRIASGNKSGYGVTKPTLLTIRSAAQKEKIHARHSRGVDPVPWQDVDFKPNQMFALFMPESRGGGVTIKSVATRYAKGAGPDDGQVVVHAIRQIPGDKCLVAAVQSTPFFVVLTRRLPGKPVLDLKTVKRKACA
ncbi:MAG TPA: hypothetical protein VGO97_03540 [Solirubrobacterales bacterium]|nr:hypothetical protein [Solirubrobacterales bacterium]